MDNTDSLKWIRNCFGLDKQICLSHSEIIL